MVYLEYIQSINHLTTLTADNILNKTHIDSSGSFLLEDYGLPDEPRLYRLILQEVDDGNYGISSGLRKNFYHIILDNQSHVDLECIEVAKSFDNCEIKSSEANRLLSYLLEELIPSYSPRSIEEYDMLVDSETNKKFRNAQRTDDLKSFADSCSHLIPSILAIRSINDLHTEVKNDPSYYRAYVNRLQTSDLLYAIEMKNELLSHLEIHFGKSNQKNLWTYISAVIIGVLLLYIFFLRNRISNLKGSKEAHLEIEALLKNLSPQEFKVLKLVGEGKTNKEIAQVLFIEVTTVKSHINKIYQKLQIKSRGQAAEISKML